MKLITLTLAAFGTTTTTLVSAAPVTYSKSSSTNFKARNEERKCHWYDAITNKICFENPKEDPSTNKVAEWEAMWAPYRDGKKGIKRDVDSLVALPDDDKEDHYDPVKNDWTSDEQGEDSYDHKEGDWMSDEEGDFFNDDVETETLTKTKEGRRVLDVVLEGMEKKGHKLTPRKQRLEERKKCPWYDWLVGHGCDA